MTKRYEVPLLKISMVQVVRPPADHDPPPTHSGESLRLKTCSCTSIPTQLLPNHFERRLTQSLKLDRWIKWIFLVWPISKHLSKLVLMEKSKSRFVCRLRYFKLGLIKISFAHFSFLSLFFLRCIFQVSKLPNKLRHQCIRIKFGNNENTCIYTYTNSIVMIYFSPCSQKIKGRN